MEWGEAIELVQSKDCGRYAIATRFIKSGEQVLLTSPYTLTFNPNMYVSAIHLNAKASSVSSGANVSSAKYKKQLNKPKGKNKNVKHTNYNTEKEELSQQHSSAVKDATHPDLLNCNFSVKSEAATGDGVDESVKEHKRTTLVTFCTCCFKEIPANTEIANSSQLEQIAQDMSVERDCTWQENNNNTQIMKQNVPVRNVNNIELINALPAWETNTNAILTDTCSPFECNRNCNASLPSKHNSLHKSEYEQEQQEEEELENKQQTHSYQHYNTKAHDKAYNKLKKPSRSAKMKSDAAVALKEHLQEQAMERRAEGIRRYIKSKKESLAQYGANTEHIEKQWNELMTSHEQCVHYLQSTAEDSIIENKSENQKNTSTSSSLKLLSDYYNLECKAEVVKLYSMLKQMNSVNMNSKTKSAQNENNTKNEEAVNDVHHGEKTKFNELHDRTDYCNYNALSRLILVGCPCCGIACFCSWRCWFRQCRRHMESGECALLRHLYFSLMEFYYTTPQSTTRNHLKNHKNEQRHRSSQKRHNNNYSGDKIDNYGCDYGNESFPVHLIGSEPASWNTNINAERALEAQCILQVSQVLVQSALEGYRGSWDSKYAKHINNKQQEEEENKETTLQESSFASTCKSNCDIHENQYENGKEGDTIEKGDKLNEDDDDDIDLMDACVAHSLKTHQNACNKNIIINNTNHKDDDATKMARRVECLTPLAEYTSPSSFIVESDECNKMNNNNDEEHLMNKSVTLTPLTSNHAHVQIPRYVDLACLVSNLNKMPKEHGRLFGRYYRTFYKHFQHIVLDVINTLTKHHNYLNSKTIIVNNNSYEKEVNLSEELENVHVNKVERMNNAVGASIHTDHTETNFVNENDENENCEEDEEEEESVSEEFFSRLGATAQCNSFGVYTSSGESIAFGFYPFASYFNHSCNPNMCRAMYEYGFQCAGFYALRDIAPQEPLTICYIDVEEENSAIRRQQLMASYRFHCGCERCAGNATEVVQPVELCTHCHIHGYMRLRWCSLSKLTKAITNNNGNTENNNNTTELNCANDASIQIKECTVCRRRVIVPTNVSNNSEKKTEDDNYNV